jgi:hypothetical protein
MVEIANCRLPIADWHVRADTQSSKIGNWKSEIGNA